MELKYSAVEVKSWIITNISPIGWSMLVSRALPELLEVNARFSPSQVGKKTRWGSDEIYILRWYMLRMYNIDFPENFLDNASTVEAGYWDWNSFSFFDGSSKSLTNIKNFFTGLLRA